MASEIPMTLRTALGTALLFKSMDATEEIGHLYEFDVEALSDSSTTKPEDLLGKPASVSVLLPSGGQRHFHGLVCAMGTEGTAQRMFRYRMFLRPWLWLLTRRTDTRVFQDLSVQDILKQVFEPFSPDYTFKLTGTLPKYEYCVQYRETDFNFVSRLMEQEGIYYYFEHTADKHTMVIVNAPSAHQPNPVQDTFEFRESGDEQREFEPITEWRARKEIQSGQVVLRDYDFVAPSQKLESVAKAPRKDASTKLEVYDYPGSYVKPADGTRYSTLRMEELQARFSRVDGGGEIRGLACGYRFKLKNHPRADQDQAYVLLSTHIQLALNAYESGVESTTVKCTFTAIEGSETFRPRRDTPRPTVAGLHTAVVVGPSGQEIFTDEHGRVKVQFHWDRLGKKDDKSSCWVRVSSPWAGQAWGAISLPRIGQEVVVDFLEGDPDRPLITGRVYNGEQKPPYKLPDNATVSTNKSRSSKGGAAANFNELRFEDAKGSEYVWFQAEKDFHQLVKNDATLVVEGNQDRLVKKDLTEQIDGIVKIKVKKDRVTEIVGKNSLKVTDDMMTEGAVSISQKSGTKTDIKIGTDLGIDAGVNVHIKAGVNVVVEAGVMITLKAGPSSVVIGPSGVSIVGPMVMINSGGSAGSGGGTSPKPVLAVKEPVNRKIRLVEDLLAAQLATGGAQVDAQNLAEPDAYRLALAAAVARAWPELQARLGPQLQPFIDVVCSSAAAHQIGRGEPLERFLNLCCAFGPNFERRPENEWALAILADERLTGRVRLHQLIVQGANALKKRRGGEGMATSDQLLRADAALLDAIDARMQATDSTYVVLSRLACDLEAVDIRLLDVDWRREYRIVDGVWQLAPLSQPPLPIRIGPGMPSPSMVCVLSNDAASTHLARLQVRLLTHAVCDQDRHPAVVFAGSHGLLGWNGHQARAVSWLVHAPGHLPATNGLGAVLFEETIPDTSLLRASTCGLRDDGVPTGEIATYVWAYPADQWLFVWQREATAARQWPPQPERGAQENALPATRCRIDRNGSEWPSALWAQSFHDTLDVELTHGLDRLFAAWSSAVTEPTMQATTAMLAGRCALAWGWHEGTRGLADAAFMRVVGDLDLGHAMDVVLAGEIVVGATRTRLRLLAQGAAPMKQRFAREQPMPTLLELLLPASVKLRFDYRIEFDPVAVEEAALWSETGPCTGALVGEIGLRPRAGGGSGWQWFARLDSEAVSVPVTVHDPLLGRTTSRVSLLPAVRLLDWSAG